jgi:hypothetical protein
MVRSEPRKGHVPPVVVPLLSRELFGRQGWPRRPIPRSLARTGKPAYS